MSVRAIVSIASILGLLVTAATAQQPAVTGPPAAAQPPLFQGIMVDARGKTVGRLLTPVPPTVVGLQGSSSYVVRQINKIWVLLPINDFTIGFQILPLQQVPPFLFQSADCTGPAFMFVNQNAVDPVTGATVPTSPAVGFGVTIPPATAPSIYFAGSPAMLTINSLLTRGKGGGCFPFNEGNPNYVGPVEIVPVSSLGLTLPFRVE
jgi:hypothetical protein